MHNRTRRADYLKSKIISTKLPYRAYHGVATPVGIDPNGLNLLEIMRNREDEMNLVKMMGALALTVLLACAPMLSESDRDVGEEYGQADNSINQQSQMYDRDQTPSQQNIPQGEEPSQYPPYYQSTR